MPCYQYCCEHGCTEEHIRKISERNDDVLCEVHGLSMHLVMGSPMVRKGAGIHSIDTPSVPKMGDYNK